MPAEAWKALAKKPEDILAPFKEFTKYMADFVRIVKLLDDKTKVDKHLSALESETQTQVGIVGNLRNGASPGVLRDLNDAQVVGMALHDALRTTELDTTFGTVFGTEVWYLEGVLSAVSFFKMMEGRILFVDPLVNVKHGAQTHRIQWWIIAREMATTSGWTAKSPAELYVATSDATASLGTNEMTVWFQTFDAIRGGAEYPRTARCPEYLLDYLQDNYPTVYRGDVAAQKWDSAPKDTSANLNGKNIVWLNRNAAVKYKPQEKTTEKKAPSAPVRKFVVPKPPVVDTVQTGTAQVLTAKLPPPPARGMPVIPKIDTPAVTVTSQNITISDVAPSLVTPMGPTTTKIPVTVKIPRDPKGKIVWPPPK